MILKSIGLEIIDSVYEEIEESEEGYKNHLIELCKEFNAQIKEEIFRF